MNVMSIYVYVVLCSVPRDENGGKWQMQLRVQVRRSATDVCNRDG